MIAKNDSLSKIFLMQYTTRFNNMPFKDRQNLAEHSFGVAALAILIGNEIAQGMARTKVMYSLDRLNLLQCALFHDFEETVTTDFPLPLKLRLGREIMSTVDSVAKDMTFSAFKEIGLDFHTKYNEWKEDMSPEFQIIKICDYLELLFWTHCNKSKFPGGSYRAVVNNCKSLIQKFPLHILSSTVSEMLIVEEFEFNF